MELLSEIWGWFEAFAVNNAAVNTLVGLVIGILAVPWRKIFNNLVTLWNYICIIFDFGSKKIKRFRIVRLTKKIENYENKMQLYEKLNSSTHDLIIHLFEVVFQFFFLFVFEAYLLLMLNMSKEKGAALLILFIVTFVLIFIHIAYNMQLISDIRRFERVSQQKLDKIVNLKNALTNLGNV